ncbi:MAG: hypothetical protein AAF710_02700 [Planctomycetota bacterium]
MKNRRPRSGAAMHRPVTCLLTAALLAFAPLTSGGGEPDARVVAAFDQAADGAEVVVVIPSLSGLSERIAAFGADTGLDRLTPEVGDVLGAFKQEMGWRQGVDDDGPMVLVVTGLADAIESELDGVSKQPDAVMLVPVADYAAFVTQSGGDPEPDVTALPRGEGGAAKKLNGFAVLGEDVAAVQDYAAGGNGKAIAEALGGVVTEYLNVGDSLIYVDVAALAPALNKLIDKGLEEAEREMAGNAGDLPPAFAGLAEAAIALYGETARQWVDGTDKLLLSLDLTERGLGMTSATQLTEDSTLAGYFAPGAEAEGEPAAAALLAALPDEPYIWASSIDASRFALDSLVDQVAEAMDAVEGGGGMLALYRESLTSLKETNGVASVFYTPDPAAMMGGGFMTTLTVYDVEDAEAYRTLQKKTFEQMADLKVPMPAVQPGGEAGEITFNTTYTDRALVIDGVEVDQYAVKTVLPPAVMQQMGPMAMMMGNTGTSGYLAAKGDKVLVTTVTDPQLITKGLAALDADGGVGSAGAIATLRNEALPADSSLELYVSVAGIAETVNPFLMMFAPNAGQLDVPDDLPPLAMGGASDGEGLALRMFFPAELVRFGVETYELFAPEARDAPGDGAPRAPRAF